MTQMTKYKIKYLKETKDERDKFFKKKKKDKKIL